jgi:hypothetical protein
MKRPLGGSENGSICFSFESRGLLDLGLFARAGENRTWNYGISASIDWQSRLENVQEAHCIAGLRLAFGRK